MTPKGDDELLTVKQTTDMLGIVRTTLYEWIAAGDIAPVAKKNPLKQRERRYFRKSDVERLLREGRPSLRKTTQD